jgi:hypothetical protein
MSGAKQDELHDQLAVIHEQLMDLLELAGTECMWVQSERGLLAIALETADPEQVNMVAPLADILNGNHGELT